MGEVTHHKTPLTSKKLENTHTPQHHTPQPPPNTTTPPHHNTQTLLTSKKWENVTLAILSSCASYTAVGATPRGPYLPTVDDVLSSTLMLQNLWCDMGLYGVCEGVGGGVCMGVWGGVCMGVWGCVCMGVWAGTPSTTTHNPPLPSPPFPKIRTHACYA